MATGSKLLIAGIVAAAFAALGTWTCCDQPSPSQQASQPSAPSSPASDEQARKEAEEKARKEAEEKARKEADEKAAADKAADDKAWAEAARVGSIAAFTVYIQSFGTGAHVTEARERLAALEQQARKDAEEKARRDTEEKARKEAEERTRKEAEEKARKETEAKAADDKAWADASRGGTTAAYSDYLKTFGKGAHAAEARKRLAALEAQARRETEGRKRALAAIPVVDIKGTCRMATGIAGSIPTRESAEACLKSEQDARNEIAKQWAEFTATDREHCINPKAYLPSYVEWLTCLEMERDVRKMKRQPAASQR